MSPIGNVLNQSELLTHILSFLDTKTLRKCCKVSKLFREILFNAKFLRLLASNAGAPIVIAPNLWLLNTIHSTEELFKYIKYQIACTTPGDSIMINFRSFSAEIIHLDLQNSASYKKELFPTQNPDFIANIWIDKEIIFDPELPKMINDRNDCSIKVRSFDSGIKKIQIYSTTTHAVKALNTAIEIINDPLQED